MSGDCFIFLFFIKTNENLLAVFESFSIDTKSKNETDNRASYFYRCNTSFDDFLSFFNIFPNIEVALPARAHAHIP